MFESYKSGALKSPRDDRDYQIENLIAGAAASSLPDEYINPLASTIEILD